MQHTIPEAASLGAPRWLRPWDDGVAEAAAATLQNEGHVVVLATLSAGCLPPPRANELAEAAASADPRGYLIRRGIARAIGASAAGVPAESLVVGRGNDGAPRLTGCPFHVSFSARGAVGVIALGRGPLGVDYEADLPPAGIPWNLLRADERASLEPLAPPAQTAAFLALWRAKEAALKALGLGFTLPPEAVHVEDSLARVDGQARPVTLCDAAGARVTLAFA